MDGVCSSGEELASDLWNPGSYLVNILSFSLDQGCDSLNLFFFFFLMKAEICLKQWGYSDQTCFAGGVFLSCWTGAMAAAEQPNHFSGTCEIYCCCNTIDNCVIAYVCWSSRSIPRLTVRVLAWLVLFFFVLFHWTMPHFGLLMK